MKYLDPLYWMTQEQYDNIVQTIVQMLFTGIFTRVLAVVFLIVGLWFVFRRKMTSTGMIFVGLCNLLIFGKQILSKFDINILG